MAKINKKNKGIIILLIIIGLIYVMNNGGFGKQSLLMGLASRDSLADCESDRQDWISLGELCVAGCVEVNTSVNSCIYSCSSGGVSEYAYFHFDDETCTERYNGNTINKCQMDCLYGGIPSAVSCTPNQYVCSCYYGTEYTCERQCNSAGNGYSPLQYCDISGGETCNPSSGRCGCVANSWQCTTSGSYYAEHQCNSAGTGWNTPVSCNGAICVESSGRCSNICADGAITSSCDCGGTVRTSGYCCGYAYQTTACGSGSCTDSDGGQDEFTAGYVNIGTTNYKRDIIKTSSSISEQYCDSYGISQWISKTCTYGIDTTTCPVIGGDCAKCLQQTGTCTEYLDSGYNYLERGYVIDASGRKDDQCTDLNNLQEWKCTGDIKEFITKNCKDYGIQWGCENGICKDAPVTCEMLGGDCRWYFGSSHPLSVGKYNCGLWRLCFVASSCTSSIEGQTRPCNAGNNFLGEETCHSNMWGSCVSTGNCLPEYTKCSDGTCKTSCGGGNACTSCTTWSNSTASCGTRTCTPTGCVSSDGYGATKSCGGTEPECSATKKCSFISKCVSGVCEINTSIIVLLVIGVFALKFLGSNK